MSIFGRRRHSSRKSAVLPGITKLDDCRSIFNSNEVSIILKHSHLCGLSQEALHTVVGFHEENAAAKVYIVSVLDSPAVSRLIENLTGVRHESPQVIAVSSGAVLAQASHRMITPAFLRQLVSP